MLAKELFEKLGYTQSENSENGIQYISKSKDSEMQRIGMVTINIIEFYPLSKEILFQTTIKFRDGSTKVSDSSVLNVEEFKAVQQQILELGW